MIILKLLGSFILINFIIGSWIPASRYMLLASEGNSERGEAPVAVTVALGVTGVAFLFLYLMWGG